MKGVMLKRPLPYLPAWLHAIGYSIIWLGCTDLVDGPFVRSLNPVNANKHPQPLAIPTSGHSDSGGITHQTEPPKSWDLLEWGSTFQHTLRWEYCQPTI